MNRFKLKKQFRRRWRQWRKALWTFFMAGAAAFAFYTVILSDNLEDLLTDEGPAAMEAMVQVTEGDSKDELSQQQKKFIGTVRSTGLNREVHLLTNYVCGVETALLGNYRAEDLASLLEQHPDWSGRLNAKGEVWLEREVADLSPMCKKNSYMGIGSGKQLTLFEGPPQKEKVIRTFFQLDIGSMETSLPEGVFQQLREGIRIQDIEEYNSVISTFSDYAVEQTRKVMGQEY
ncbi:BofC C-terminal domain-containing protein [Paenibacillus sp. P96]|uniref:BofC C-terminal domain-containing protein n=1 Tax=Paenibacillus zeirhizosphaerae TaxID=2987519 RepID=A0ABT9FKD0_9BACL|nr:BofC C-terminal domain-containing protein [Paenibacillus sp. P96]MDP4095185.1 BofC C-terminal domain-containing protein [Paenibacillus sp. P96]